MDNETRAAFTALNGTVTVVGEKLTGLDATVTAGFARMERYFQIQHKWMQGWLDELRHDRELRGRTDAVSKRVARLEHEVEPPRDYITRELAEIRLELFELGYEAWQNDYLRRQLAALRERVDRLDPR